MKSFRLQKLALLALFALATGSSGRAEETFASGDVYARVTADRVVLGNSLVERSWRRASFATEALVDHRGKHDWTVPGADFALLLDGVDVASSLFAASAVTVEPLERGGLRVTFTLTPLLPLPAGVPPGIEVIRGVEAYPKIAGFRSETTVMSLAPLLLSGYSLDEIHPPQAVSVAIHSFRAGADWRDPGWPGPPVAIGDPHAGTWRVTERKSLGAAIAGTAQWMSLASIAGNTAFFVLERNDYASSRMAYDGRRARALVDLSRDVVYIGPFEESAHVENSTPLPARHRLIPPGASFHLESVFTGFGASAYDEPWQHFKYLEGHRMPPYRREVTFNTNGVDSNRISTGAKDDMDFAEFQRQLAVAREIGIETFILDDGWQARSGDWCPHSPQCPEPRDDGSPASKFRPRFPDDEFSAVRRDLGEMNLGLWMTPMHFHPSSHAFQQHPQWACLPVSLGLVAVNLADPDSGSNEAGIGTWNPQAIDTQGTKLIDYVEGRIRTAIEDWGVRYFKFDFTVWLDCVGAHPVDMYSYRESFMAMLDRLNRDYPGVTIQMDETNDYRLFPFEAIARGPMWYQNGSPAPHEALHASWILAPYLPPFALGRNALRNGAWNAFSVDYLMAVALPSHFTFFNDLTAIPQSARFDPDVKARIRAWTSYYKAHRADLATFTYPLLADPLGADDWTALQPWNPEAARGALLVYRQSSPVETMKIALHNVPPGRMFRLLEAPDDILFLEASSADLSSGICITIPAVNSARVFRIEPLS